MAFDGITMAALADELNQKIIGGRISKISQPEKEEIILTIKNEGNQYRLFLSASPSLPLIYLTDANKQSPMTAPNFCMVLRKHLQGAKILSVATRGLERVISLSMEHLDEMGDLCVRTLNFELMGKYSNLILCDSDATIIDSLKHVSASMSSVREVLPGRAYFVPAQENKKDILTATREEFLQLFEEAAVPAYKVIYTSYVGISPFVAKELCNETDTSERILAKDLSQESKEDLWKACCRMISCIKERCFEPVVFYENKNLYEFAVTPVYSFEKNVCKKFDSVSGMLQFFYEERNTADIMRQKSFNLRKQVQTILERDYKKLDLQNRQLQEAGNKEKYRIYGELLNAFGYQIENGTKQVTLQNYYDGTDVTIPLDETKTATENAKRYFDKYVKMKRTEEALQVQISETQKEIAYLESVQTFLAMALSEDDLNQIRLELYENRYIRKKPEKSRNKMKSKPLHYRTPDGYDIYVGKNNLQNEELTHKIAGGNDWWFHAKGVPGSHVVVKASFENPATEWDMPDEVFEAAAALAAMYSKNKEQDKVEVDYLRKKHVKRPAGGDAGFVVYYTNFSMVIESNIERFALTLVNE